MSSSQFGASGVQSGDVVAVEGLEDQALVARVEQGEQSGVEGAGGAAGDNDFAVGVNGEAVEGSELARNRLAKWSDALMPGVDVMPGTDGFDGRFDDRVRRIGVADALREVDAVDGSAGNRHGADLRLRRVRSEMAEVQVAGGRRDGRHKEGRASDSGARPSMVAAILRSAQISACPEICPELHPPDFRPLAAQEG
jgi:hypothetical protein